MAGLWASIQGIHPGLLLEYRDTGIQGQEYRDT